MKNEADINKLTAIIEEYLNNGITAGSDVIRFARSALGIGSIPEIRTLLSSGDRHCGGMLELILYPDDGLRTAIEPFVPDCGLTCEETARISNLVKQSVVKVLVSFEGTDYTAEAYPPEWMIDAFVKKLNLGMEFDWPEDFHMPGGFAREQFIAAKVILRKSDWHPTPQRWKFLSLLIQKFIAGDRIDGADLCSLFDFMLGLFAETAEDRDVRQLISDKRGFLEDNLKGMIEFRNELRKSSMEVLMLRRVPAPAMNLEEIRGRIRVADLICHRIFGTVPVL